MAGTAHGQDLSHGLRVPWPETGTSFTAHTPVARVPKRGAFSTRPGDRHALSERLGVSGSLKRQLTARPSISPLAPVDVSMSPSLSSITGPASSPLTRAWAATGSSHVEPSAASAASLAGKAPAGVEVANTLAHLAEERRKRQELEQKLKQLEHNYAEMRAALSQHGDGSPSRSSRSRSSGRSRSRSPHGRSRSPRRGRPRTPAERPMRPNFVDEAAVSAERRVRPAVSSPGSPRYLSPTSQSLRKARCRSESPTRSRGIWKPVSADDPLQTPLPPAPAPGWVPESSRAASSPAGPMGRSEAARSQPSSRSRSRSRRRRSRDRETSSRRSRSLPHNSTALSDQSSVAEGRSVGRRRPRRRRDGDTRRHPKGSRDERVANSRNDANADGVVAARDLFARVRTLLSEPSGSGVSPEVAAPPPPPPAVRQAGHASRTASSTKQPNNTVMGRGYRAGVSPERGSTGASRNAVAQAGVSERHESPAALAAPSSGAEAATGGGGGSMATVRGGAPVLHEPRTSEDPTSTSPRRAVRPVADVDSTLARIGELLDSVPPEDAPDESPEAVGFAPKVTTVAAIPEEIAGDAEALRSFVESKLIVMDRALPHWSELAHQSPTDAGSGRSGALRRMRRLVEEDAATQLQAVARGFLVRRDSPRRRSTALSASPRREETNIVDAIVAAKRHPGQKVSPTRSPMYAPPVDGSRFKVGTGRPFGRASPMRHRSPQGMTESLSLSQEEDALVAEFRQYGGLPDDPARPTTSAPRPPVTSPPLQSDSDADVEPRPPDTPPPESPPPAPPRAGRQWSPDIETSHTATGAGSTSEAVPAHQSFLEAGLARRSSRVLRDKIANARPRLRSRGENDIRLSEAFDLDNGNVRVDDALTVQWASPVPEGSPEASPSAHSDDPMEKYGRHPDLGSVGLFRKVNGQHGKGAGAQSTASFSGRGERASRVGNGHRAPSSGKSTSRLGYEFSPAADTVGTATTVPSERGMGRADGAGSASGAVAPQDASHEVAASGGVTPQSASPGGRSGRGARRAGVASGRRVAMDARGNLVHLDRDGTVITYDGEATYAGRKVVKSFAGYPSALDIVHHRTPLTQPDKSVIALRRNEATRSHIKRHGGRSATDDTSR